MNLRQKIGLVLTDSFAWETDNDFRKLNERSSIKIYVHCFPGGVKTQPQTTQKADFSQVDSLNIAQKSCRGIPPELMARVLSTECQRY
jgi:hypothetical protein